MKGEYVYPRSWGPHFWFMMRCIAFNYPEEPTAEEVERVKSFYNNFKFLLPCVKCQDSYRFHLRENPVDNALHNRERLIQWVEQLYLETQKTISEIKKDDIDKEMKRRFKNRLNGKEVLFQELTITNEQRDKVAVPVQMTKSIAGAAQKLIYIPSNIDVESMKRRGVFFNNESQPIIPTEKLINTGLPAKAPTIKKTEVKKQESVQQKETFMVDYSKAVQPRIKQQPVINKDPSFYVGESLFGKNTQAEIPKIKFKKNLVPTLERKETGIVQNEPALIGSFPTQPIKNKIDISLIQKDIPRKPLGDTAPKATHPKNIQPPNMLPRIDAIIEKIASTKVLTVPEIKPKVEKIVPQQIIQKPEVPKQIIKKTQLVPKIIAPGPITSGAATVTPYVAPYVPPNPPTNIKSIKTTPPIPAADPQNLPKKSSDAQFSSIQTAYGVIKRKIYSPFSGVAVTKMCNCD